MKRTTTFRAHDVNRIDRADGTILLTSNDSIGPVSETTGVWLHQWADVAPDRVFLAERYGTGWRCKSYGAVLDQVRAIATTLVARGMGADTPLLIMSGNGVDHGLLSLAAQYVGIPTVPVAEQYSLISGAHGRLQQVVELVCPAMAYVIDASQYAEALDLNAFGGVEVVASRTGDTKATAFAELLKGDAGVDVNAAHRQVGPDTVAKILMTSGSTSAPKGVLTTQRMMCTNQAQIAAALPFLKEHPPRIVDWLPWNHVFGGSHNFNMMLANGGTYYIDDGKPVKGLFDRTVENLGLVTGTLCFNVPVGFRMLHDALQNDATLRGRFFKDLDLLFYAGASLPQDVWEGFENMAMDVKGEVPLMTSSWGLTETAPAVTMQQEPTDRSGVVGVPLSAVTAKLVPMDDARFEVRVKGPNVMPGYFEAPDKTAEAFDDEGFFITGDAMRFVEADNINKGLKFDGRISEDFKLSTGTWVRATALRIDILACLSPLAADLVITGADRDQIGVLIFPDIAALERKGFDCAYDGSAMTDKHLLGEVRRRLAEHAASGASGSTRIARALILSDPPSMPDAEITAKGNLNFNRILTLRAGLLARLYDDADPAVTKI
jgi:feruloyl-CoA synthase